MLGSWCTLRTALSPHSLASGLQGRVTTTRIHCLDQGLHLNRRSRWGQLLVCDGRELHFGNACCCFLSLQLLQGIQTVWALCRRVGQDPLHRPALLAIYSIHRYHSALECEMPGVPHLCCLSLRRLRHVYTFRLILPRTAVRSTLYGADPLPPARNVREVAITLLTTNLRGTAYTARSTHCSRPCAPAASVPAMAKMVNHRHYCAPGEWVESQSILLARSGWVSRSVLTWKGVPGEWHTTGALMRATLSGMMVCEVACSWIAVTPR